MGTPSFSPVKWMVSLVITFQPDNTIFADTEFRYETLETRLRELAFLNQGVRLSLTDERETDENGNFMCGAVMRSMKVSPNTDGFFDITHHTFRTYVNWGSLV